MYVSDFGDDVCSALPDMPTVGDSGVMGSFGAIPPPDPTPFLKGHPRSPSADERGWKNTVIAYPGEVLRILVPFGRHRGGHHISILRRRAAPLLRRLRLALSHPRTRGERHDAGLRPDALTPTRAFARRIFGKKIRLGERPY